MNPGDLKQILIFQQPAGGVDGEGYPILEPTVYLKTRGALKTLRGTTRYVAAQSQMENNREFGIRYHKKLDEQVRPPNLQVIWNGTVHDIVSIENDDGLNKTMTVICKAVGK
jgi:SPP1 family predicted phage head-tail adaptor